ncbi:MAG: CvpA family protein [Lachnospiraceae bacterium]|jgi:uncharacterized membrane protein required for colicin V production
MNLYVILIVAVSILLEIGFCVRGFHKGFAHEISAVLSLIFSAVIVVLLSGLLKNITRNSIIGIIWTVIVLIIFIICYRLIHGFLEAINFIAKLPLIRWLDGGLGVVIGFIEGFAILYLIEYLLRNFILI